MTGLQARRDAQTRAELSSAAIRLFAEHGFTETTMTQVAEAAGVSRRTAYRHFPTKEDLLFEQPRLWLELFQSIVADRQEGESTRTLCCRAVLAVAHSIEENRVDVLSGYGIVAATPSLHTRYSRTNRDWLDAYVELFAADMHPTNTDSLMKASILAGALVGGTDRAALVWALQPNISLVALTQRTLDGVESCGQRKPAASPALSPTPP